MTEEALAAFFQADAPMRISTLSSERMIVQRLIDLFGENELFNEDIAAEMKRNMIKDLEENRKEEYMSEPGKFSFFLISVYVSIVCSFTLYKEIAKYWASFKPIEIITKVEFSAGYTKTHSLPSKTSPFRIKTTRKN